MVCQRVAEPSVAGDDLERAELDEGREDPLEDRVQRVGDRVQLEHDRAVGGVQLLECVQRRQGEDVPGPQHQCHALCLVRRALTEADAGTRLGLGDTGPQPDLGAEPAEQQLVEGAVR